MSNNDKYVKAFDVFLHSDDPEKLELIDGFVSDENHPANNGFLSRSTKSISNHLKDKKLLTMNCFEYEDGFYKQEFFGEPRTGNVWFLQTAFSKKKIEMLLFKIKK